MGKKILVVDDERKVCELLQAYLEREGFMVASAHDGKAAVLAADQIKPDLVLLDLTLPGLDGIDVCKELRKS